MKARDRHGLNDGGVLSRRPLGGVIVECWYISISFCYHIIGGQVWIPSRGTSSARVGWSRDLLSVTHDLVVTSLRSRCPLDMIDTLRPGARGRRPSPAKTWWVRYDDVRWFYKGVVAPLVSRFGCFFGMSLLIFVRGFPSHFVYADLFIKWDLKNRYVAKLTIWTTFLSKCKLQMLLIKQAGASPCVTLLVVVNVRKKK